MNPSIKERCEFLNIDNNVLRYGECMPSSIEIHFDIPQLQYQYEKELLIHTVLLPSIKDTINDTYPHLTIDYMYSYDMISLGFYPTPRQEELFIDIIEHIINIIETIYDDNKDTEDIIDIQYDRSITTLRIY